MREDEYTEFKKTTGELNEAMVSISSILNKHRQGKIYFGLKNDGKPIRFTITDSTLRDVSRKIFEAIRPQIIPTVATSMRRRADRAPCSRVCSGANRSSMTPSSSPQPTMSI